VGDGKRTKQQRSKGVVETEAEKEAKRRAQKKGDIYRATKGWMYDDGKELQVAGSEVTAEGVKRMCQREDTNRMYTKETYGSGTVWGLLVPHDRCAEHTDDAGMDDAKEEGSIEQEEARESEEGGRGSEKTRTTSHTQMSMAWWNI
jgi:hypothetical protein